MYWYSPLIYNSINQTNENFTGTYTYEMISLKVIWQSDKTQIASYIN
jgi:hypothetical protein